MGRTKATAKKTTGGPAKRAELPQFKKVSLNIGTPHVIKSIFPKSTSSREKPKPSIKSSHNILMDGRYADYENHRGVSEGNLAAREAHASLSQYTHERITSTASFAEMVVIFMIAPAALGRISGCHKIRGKRSRNDGIRAYFGFEDIKGNPILGAPVTIHGHSEMTSRSQICSDPILILHFVLQTVDPLGSPAGVMREILRPYKPSDKLQYHEIMFDIGTMEKIEKHRLSMAKLTTRGDIWGGFEDAEPVGRGRKKVIKQGEPIAYSIDDFFAALFVGGIEEYLKGATLWMLVCGHMVRELDALNVYKACVKHYQIEHAFAFGAELFHACLTTSFIVAYVDRVLVEGLEVQDVIQDLLIVSPRLAMHACIVHVHVMNTFRRRFPTIAEYTQGLARIPGAEVSTIVSTYTFFHDNNRPFGQTLPYQCSTCKCIRTWERTTSTLDEIQFACRKCKHEITYTKHQESKIILYSQGYRGTSSGSGQLVRKGNTAGSGWLVSVTTELAAVALVDSTHPPTVDTSTTGGLFVSEVKSTALGLGMHSAIIRQQILQISKRNVGLSMGLKAGKDRMSR
ncbi:hypothetical protein F4604DRAFT_1686187 [Suillus subluteus]|nr:hypothetical protein F4604DRAFT_1686187 [Suillus subluteus]